MPAHLASANAITAAQYAKAVEAANHWAYLSVGNLKHALGVTAQTSQAVLARLQADGFIASTGQGGAALTQKYVLENARITAKALSAQRMQTAKTGLKEMTDTIKRTLPDPMDEGDRDPAVPTEDTE